MSSEITQARVGTLVVWPFQAKLRVTQAVSRPRCQAESSRVTQAVSGSRGHAKSRGCRLGQDVKQNQEVGAWITQDQAVKRVVSASRVQAGPSRITQAVSTSRVKQNQVGSRRWSLGQESSGATRGHAGGLYVKSHAESSGVTPVVSRPRVKRDHAGSRRWSRRQELSRVTPNQAGGLSAKMSSRVKRVVSRPRGHAVSSWWSLYQELSGIKQGQAGGLYVKSSHRIK